MHKHVISGALLFGIAAFVSCEPEASGPLVDESPVTEAEVVALNDVLDVYESILATTPMLALRQSGMAVVESLLIGRAPSSLGGGNSTAGLTAAALPSVLPPLLATTWVFDSTVGLYVEDVGRLGAPGNGVRIILYQPGAATSGYVEIGWIDIIEDGLGKNDEYRVRVRGIQAGGLFADYEVKVKGKKDPPIARPEEIDVKGTIFVGPDLLEFDLQSEGKPRNDPELKLDWKLEIKSQRFKVDGEIKDIPLSGQGVENIDLDIRLGDTQLQILSSTEEAQIGATIIANGKELAIATGLISQPTIVGSAGTTLSQEVGEMIARFLTLVPGVFETYNDLFTPPGAVIFQGLQPPLAPAR